MRENCGGCNGLHITSYYADLWLEDDMLQPNFSNKKKNNNKKNKSLLPIYFPLGQHITCTSQVFQCGGGPSAEEVEDAGPSPWRKPQVLSSAHFPIKTILTGFTCGAATCLPSRLFVRVTFSSQISSMCNLVNLDLQQNKLVETSDLSTFN